MSEELERAWASVGTGDVAEALRHLRAAAGEAEPGELARVAGKAAEVSGFDDLREASDALAAEPESPQALYDFGYASIERGAAFLAVPALTECLRWVPDEHGVLTELVTALEDEHRHTEAVAVLAEREATLEDWPERYLLAYNAAMAGDLDRARAVLAALGEPADERWAPARERIGRILARADVARGASQLDFRDLRGWHFVLGGGLLATISPHGADAMAGRYAYLQVSYGLCLHVLRRLRRVLRAAGRSPRAVALLPDRSSRILGLAAAEVLGVPTEPFLPGSTGVVVVAYDLTDVDDDILASLRGRPAGQVLHEHATCWTDPPPVAADVSGLLHEMAVAPWGEGLRAGEDGSVERTAVDQRPVEELAAEILRADAEPDVGDDDAPPDPDEELSGFAAAVAAEWLVGDRDRLRSPGPVPSARFT